MQKSDDNINQLIYWNELWNEAVKGLPDKKSSGSWDKIAPKFGKWTQKDNYSEELLNKIKIDRNDTVLDIGCGNGIVTIPLAKKAKQVTAMDMSPKMLDMLKENAENEGLDNITFVNQRIEGLDVKNGIEPHDVVLASRCLNGICDIGELLQQLDQIAKKYVYITLWGVLAREFDRECAEIIGKEFNQHPDYICVYNILHQLGIYANVEMLETGSQQYYPNIDKAIEKLRWRIGGLADEEEIILRKYLAERLVKTEDSKFTLPYNNPTWVLIWWKK